MKWEGFVFNIDYWGKTATITKYTGDQTKIVIPASIKEDDDEFAVKFIGWYKVYVNHDDVYHSREIVGHHLRHFRIVGAFRQSKITDVTVPESITSIERLAFPEGTVIHGNLGSNAEKYAKEYGHRFEPI